MVIVRQVGLGLLLLLCVGPLHAEFRASVDRRVVDENDVVVLELARDAQVFVGNPDLSALDDDFRILGTQRSSQFTIVNGRTRSLTTWTVTLQPKRRGTLRIPSIEYDGERTQPIVITVTQPSPEEVEALERTVFFETEAGKDSLWVQEQVLYTVRLYYAADAVLFGDLPPPPNVVEAVVQALGDSRPDVEVRDGVRYNVIEQRYAVIPQRSGTLVIPPETFSGAVRIAERGQTRRKNIRISSEGHRIEVRPQPSDWPADAAWLPARDLMLSQRWDPPLSSLRAGEPTTRSLELVARGIAASALPRLPPTEVAGVNVYPNQPVLDEGMAAGDFIASRIEATVLIPERAGPLVLPEVRVPWFDVDLGEVRLAVIPEQRLEVAPGDAGAAPAAPPEPMTAQDRAPPASPSSSEPEAADTASAPATTLPTRGFALFALFALVTLGLLVLLLAGLWWATRHRPGSEAGVDAVVEGPPPVPDVRALRGELRAACARDDAARARRAVTRWRELTHLDAGQREELAGLVAELDDALFGRSDRPWSGRALADFLSDRAAADRAVRGPAAPALPPLHPAPSTSETT